MKVVPLTVLDRLSIVPFGWVSCVDTINSESSDSITDGPNSTTQLTVTEEVTLIGLDGVLVTVTESGVGTRTEGGRVDYYDQRSASLLYLMATNLLV